MKRQFRNNKAPLQRGHVGCRHGAESNGCEYNGKGVTQL